MIALVALDDHNLFVESIPAMKKTILIIFAFCCFHVTVAQNDMMEKKKLYDLLEQRKQRFNSYSSSIEKRSGIFGNKTKKDLQQSNEILREVVRTDNDIINVLNRAVDFKTYEKVNLNYNVNENSQQLENLTRATDTLEKQVMFLKKENTTLQEDAKWAKAKIITLLIALMIMILFIRRKRKQF